jgi:hypothetical protein
LRRCSRGHSLLLALDVLEVPGDLRLQLADASLLAIDEVELALGKLQVALAADYLSSPLGRSSIEILQDRQHLFSAGFVRKESWSCEPGAD